MQLDIVEQAKHITALIILVQHPHLVQVYIVGGKQLFYLRLREYITILSIFCQRLDDRWVLDYPQLLCLPHDDHVRLDYRVLSAAADVLGLSILLIRLFWNLANMEDPLLDLIIGDLCYPVRTKPLYQPGKIVPVASNGCFFQILMS